MLVYILYRHVEQNFDDIESTSENQHVIKEYQFYISDDCTHDTNFVQHCFDNIYESLKSDGIKFNEHWIWLNGCTVQFKSSRSSFWLCHLHKKTNIKHY